MRLLVLITFTLAVACAVALYARRQHIREASPILPLFDSAKPAFRASLPDWPIRGPVLISELPGPEESISI